MIYEKLKKQLESQYPDCKIIAVSKMQTVEKIKALYEHGHRDFAENYVQELLTKQAQLPHDIQWHFIGKLQTNKIKTIVGKVALIHSVDSLKVALEINKWAQKLNLVQNILLQVNISQELTKNGFSIEELHQNIHQIQNLPNLKIKGLMTMPPLQNQPEQNVIYFQKCKELLKELHSSQKISQNNKELSMGTSSDYMEALAEGSTMVRLGTVLFGERNYL